MDYREYAPPVALKPFLSCLWSLEGKDRGRTPQRVLPDGSVELVLHLADQFGHLDQSGVASLQPRALVVGDVTRAIQLKPGHHVEVIGARFRPGMAGAVLAVPPRAIFGTCQDLQALSPGGLGDLLEVVGNARGMPARVAVLSQRLSWAAERGPRPPAELAHAMERITSLAGQVVISDLAEESGWSLRHLERMMIRETGMTPKRLSRLMRFQRVVAKLDQNQTPVWSRLAIRAGYHDQSHLIREFREFAGVTPAAYWQELHPLSDFFHGAVDFVQDQGGVES